MEKKLKHLLQFLDIDKSVAENLLAIAFSFIIILTAIVFWIISKYIKFRGTNINLYSIFKFY